ncbi:hypothetical protein lbkm_2091 [Lachnospiraceae bacterium KM106-2]|nr:hypothetical protein lbkm_2091 [Lachnospiraceae bacterium KM106-2]
MKYYVVEGSLKNQEKMTDEIMKEHMAYTGKRMEDGRILLSGLKKDMSGGIFIMKAESREELESYLEQEPFHQNGIQDYKVTEFDAHYFKTENETWFAK